MGLVQIFLEGINKKQQDLRRRDRLRITHEGFCDILNNRSETGWSLVFEVRCGKTKRETPGQNKSRGTQDGGRGQDDGGSDDDEDQDHFSGGGQGRRGSKSRDRGSDDRSRSPSGQPGAGKPRRSSGSGGSRSGGGHERNSGGSSTSTTFPLLGNGNLGTRNTNRPTRTTTKRSTTADGKRVEVSYSPYPVPTGGTFVIKIDGQTLKVPGEQDGHGVLATTSTTAAQGDDDHGVDHPEQLQDPEDYAGNEEQTTRLSRTRHLEETEGTQLLEESSEDEGTRLSSRGEQPSRTWNCCMRWFCSDASGHHEVVDRRKRIVVFCRACRDCLRRCDICCKHRLEPSKNDPRDREFESLLRRAAALRSFVKLSFEMRDDWDDIVHSAPLRSKIDKYIYFQECRNRYSRFGSWHCDARDFFLHVLEPHWDSFERDYVARNFKFIPSPRSGRTYVGIDYHCDGRGIRKEYEDDALRDWFEENAIAEGVASAEKFAWAIKQQRRYILTKTMLHIEEERAFARQRGNACCGLWIACKWPPHRISAASLSVSAFTMGGIGIYHGFQTYVDWKQGMEKENHEHKHVLDQAEADHTIISLAELHMDSHVHVEGSLGDPRTLDELENFNEENKSGLHLRRLQHLSATKELPAQSEQKSSAEEMGTGTPSPSHLSARLSGTTSREKEPRHDQAVEEKADRSLLRRPPRRLAESEDEAPRTLVQNSEVTKSTMPTSILFPAGSSRAPKDEQRPTPERRARTGASAEDEQDEDANTHTLTSMMKTLTLEDVDLRPKPAVERSHFAGDAFSYVVFRDEDGNLRDASRGDKLLLEEQDASRITVVDIVQKNKRR
ncbi:unnamed protein product [Amoebophrya sp. A25]|nr:unnamed protein product [Amoebophrya sp. A25]|eukprot:GSA25T00012640001.1